MVIDFHTHIFPEKIAKSTIDALQKRSNGVGYTDGTDAGLLLNMENAGVDIAVSLPVLTKPTQFESVTNFAISINEKYKNSSRRIISFAGMHPECEEIPKKMRFLKDNGFLGVKIHPDYQNSFINHEGYISILNEAKENDLIVVTHAGVDDGYKGEPVKCPPQLCAEVIKKTNHKKFVLGHYGAHRQWNDALDLLCDLDVYFDTAFTVRTIDEELFKKILYRLGEDNVLFATDCPWRDMKQDLQTVKSFNLGKEIEDKILYKNALKLLKLDK